MGKKRCGGEVKCRGCEVRLIGVVAGMAPFFRGCIMKCDVCVKGEGEGGFSLGCLLIYVISCKYTLV